MNLLDIQEEWQYMEIILLWTKKVKLDVTNLSSGIYYITVQNGENIFREKIIKID
ncbi:MAG: T9SS type A sorting domain-containing protein [Saprospiraceae bacterium]|nr:T9SS type A sorting domain-containing protein [Saprospiraceae bacterium]